MVGSGLAILILVAIYALVIVLLVLLLRRLRVTRTRAIILGFLIYGALSGLLVAWAWPVESSLYGNMFAVLLGDKLYQLSIADPGDSHSANAHETIPWLLRIPQVYVPVSIILSGLVSLPIQWLYSGSERRSWFR